MSRTLSGPTATAAGKTFTQPGYFVQLGFSTVQRFSSRGDITWNGQNWLNNNIDVKQLQESPNGSANVSLVIGNSDLAFGAVCLNEQPQGKLVSIWAFYEGAVAAADPVPFFSGEIDESAIGEDAVTLTLTDSNASTIIIPRQRITRAAGFSRLVPAGRVIEFGGLRIELTAPRQ